MPGIDIGDATQPLDDLLRKPWLVVLTLIAVVALGLLAALPHMRDAIWQDEAVTLMFQSAHGVVYPFLNYNSPNNHILFSSMLGGWMGLFPDGVDVFKLRLLPLIFFLASIPATWFATRKLGGTLCALIATTLFTTASVTASFATQLRGYGPSWLFFSLMLLCGLSLFGSRATLWRAGYLLTSFAAVALLPSNFFLALAISGAIILGVGSESFRWERSRLTAIVIVVAAPFIGLIAYSGVWDELRQQASGNLSEWTRMDLLSNWLRATFVDTLWLVPLMLAGLVSAVHAWKKSGNPDSGLTVALGLLLGLVAALLAMPSVPFPRTLSPYLPVWFGVVGLLVSRALHHFHSRKALVPIALTAAIAVALLAYRPFPTCRDAPTPVYSSRYDLCYQYFHQDYHPDQVAAVLRALDVPNVTVVSDYEGFYALRILSGELNGVRIAEYRSYDGRGAPNPIIVGTGDEHLARLASELALQPTSYKLVADTGYFKVYAQPGLQSHQKR